ncbi:MAG: hypothetical protein ABF289_15150, partial [Clostridiales bacterium]
IIKNFIRQFFSENIDALTNFQKKLISLFFDSALCYSKYFEGVIKLEIKNINNSYSRHFSKKKIK